MTEHHVTRPGSCSTAQHAPASVTLSPSPPGVLIDGDRSETDPTFPTIRGKAEWPPRTDRILNRAYRMRCYQ